MFFRLHTDGVAQPVDLRGLFAGPERTACWIIGGGPSLADLPTGRIAASPLPKFCVNLAGHGLLRPTFWTSYDPTCRFQRSIYLDPSILKFVHRCRAMDLVPESTFKVCDCPATLFFEREPLRGFHDFLSQETRVKRQESQERRDPANGSGLLSLDSGLTDWQDSLIQAIEIAFHLGFRKLYLAGCDMVVRPSAEQLALAKTAGIEHQPRETLRSFFDRCRQSGLPLSRFERLPQPGLYHFDESKSLAAAIQTDLHYFRVAQYLRLSRRAMSLAGLELISVTPDSRLNDCFAYIRIDETLTEIQSEVGDPSAEPTRGRYSQSQARLPDGLSPMKDFPPHNWKRRGEPPRTEPKPQRHPHPQAATPARGAARRGAAPPDALPEIPVYIDERG
jgi:hypothetical protein